MNSKKAALLITDYLESSEAGQDGDFTIRSFETEGVLTSNDGFTIRIDDEEFQITVVKK